MLVVVSSPFTIGWRCPFSTWCHWKLHALRAKPNTYIQLQATGPCERPAYEDPCHITWLMTVHVFPDSATASEGADAHSQSPASVRCMQGSRCEDGIGGHSASPKVPERKQVPHGHAECEYVEVPLVQETRWSCCKSRDIERGFKAVLCGIPRTTSGVTVIVSERFRDSITGCSDQAKDEFWNLFDEKTAEVPSKYVIITADDLNGHVGATKGGYSYHGGSRNADGERILEYAESHSFTIVNTVFRKRDAKIVPYETVATQHRPLICILKIAPPRLKQTERCCAARIKW
ncbi:unnamed protein product [Heligmosomoides polygyrus]|uniref:Endo/exonuclease/phosphatase domain-containing protein n=1 Tax=Heligmosomoides polygyrus TaxID=6339 RepID=A0A183F8J2_HELPZ|nr:unnamed protein product [Heligmosomoides polygyrus]